MPLSMSLLVVRRFAGPEWALTEANLSLYLVLGDVFEGSEASHGESGDGASGLFGEGAEGGVYPGDEFLDVEGLPAAWPQVRGHRVAVPPRYSAIGHDNDEIASGCQSADIVFLVELHEILRPAVEQVQHRIAATAVVAVGQEYVDPGFPCDRWSGDLVVLHPTVGLVFDDV